jgi:hypothetical protein
MKSKFNNGQIWDQAIDQILAQISKDVWNLTMIQVSGPIRTQVQHQVCINVHRAIIDLIEK